MPKQFKKDQLVVIAGMYQGKILGKDWLDDTLYRVEVMNGPQMGKVLSYKPNMLK